MILHHLNNSRSQRVLWLLEELGLPYELRKYERDPKTMLAPRELKAVHPLGKSPVLTDGEVVVAESAAILEYLVDQAGGQLRPPAGTPEFLRYRYWMHFAEGSAMNPLLLTLVFRRLPKPPTPALLRPLMKGVSMAVHQAYLNRELRLYLDFMEEELKKSSWFAGPEFSAADIQMSFPLEGFASLGGALPPIIRAYLERIHARPAYQRALEKGGPFDLAF